VRILAAVVALLAISFSLADLLQARAGLEVRETRLGPTPVTVYRQADVESAPAVVVAHGFAGSQELMEPFAVSLANAGYVAVTYDLLGHGANRDPLRGDVRDERGATRFLLEEMAKVVAYAEGLESTDGRVALLGHSMSSDLVVRYAKQNPEQIAATVAVSLFSRQVTADEPQNMLVIVGAWEPGLTDEGLRVLRLTGGEGAQEGETVGSFAEGNARRLVFADRVEHIGVLFSAESLAESVAWLNRVFGRSETGELETRGWSLLGVFGGLVLLAWPASHLLPVAATRRRAARGPEVGGAGWQVAGLGADLGWRRLLPLALAPAVLTPLILWPVPTDFLPILVGDYLAAHFALYGVLTGLGLWLFGGRGSGLGDISWSKTIRASLLALLYGGLLFGLAMNAFFLNLEPTPSRWPTIAVALAGTLAYFLADEWLTRGEHARRGAYPLTKICFAVSLGIAVALDIESLFFLIIIVPLILVFFLIYGLLSRWAYRTTRVPFVAAVANALVFAWAVAVTFPVLGG
jgi:pimeloyl-ACP methyl ester carboxylesterase